MIELQFNEMKSIDSWPKGCDFVMFIDENNSTGDYKSVLKKKNNKIPINDEEKYFTLTGCIIDFDEHKKLKKLFNELRFKYWHNGLWLCNKNQEYRKVVFHSRDIRKGKDAFSQMTNKDEFINELSLSINQVNFTLISVSINLEKYVMKNECIGIYEIALQFLLERLICFLNNHQKCSIILESRGCKEDKHLLENINKILFEFGINTVSGSEIMSKIKNIYFNGKTNEGKTRPYPGLELADLCSYPIHKYVTYNKKDLSFEAIEKKMDKYPDYINKGIKVFPESKKNRDK